MTFPEKDDMSACFREITKKEPNRTNTLISLWRKDYFLKLLIKDEDPWTYEKESSIRSLFAGYKIFTQDYNRSRPAFHYCMSPVDGFGITQRKWLKNNKPFFESHGIYGVNYENLGMFSEEVTYESIHKLSQENRKVRQTNRKKEIKNLNTKDRLKELLYGIKKKIMKSKLVGWLKYQKKCFYYYNYYKNH